MTNLKSLILKHDRPVPRYTSYPTAPHFLAHLDPVLYEEWLSQLPESEAASLYIHIPFCPKLCHFCGCNTRIVNTQAPIESYIEQLKKEVTLVARAIPKKLTFNNLHFGGGSPTILPPACFGAFMDFLRAHMNISTEAEIAVEVDPRQFSEARAAVYAKCGINRISIGVQDFDEKTLAAVNRPQSFHQVYETLSLCRDYGIDNINMDFMYGLPYQTVTSVKSMMEKALLLKPDRISFFGYAHVPWLKKHMRLIPDHTLPDASLRYDLFDAGAETLRNAGYVQIGIDHFAKPEDRLVQAWQQKRLHRNFQGYVTDTTKNLIGLGASAIGKTPAGYIQNTPNVPQYRDRLDAGKLPVEKYYILTPEDRLRADIIERLMCDMEADLNSICLAHKMPWAVLTDSLRALQPLLEDNLISMTNEKLKINTPWMARTTCAAFDAYLQPKTQHHAANV